MVKASSLPDYPLEDYARTYLFRYAEKNIRISCAPLHPLTRMPAYRNGFCSFMDSSESSGTLHVLRSMTQGIFKHFTYTRRIEKGVQTPDKTLESGRGSAGILPCL